MFDQTILAQISARSAAAVLHLYGLLRKGNEALVPYAVRMMLQLAKTRSDRQGPLGLAEGSEQTFSRECKVAFAGVFDTVSSVGWFANPLSLPNTADNPDIAVARHAVAMDERRAFFRQNLWRPTSPAGGPRDLKQVWFPGSHSDVGGGYPFPESGLSQFALEWMLIEATAQGLLTDRARVMHVLGEGRETPYVRPDANQALHESLTPGWWFAEFVPKKHFDQKTGRMGWRMNLFRRRTMPPASLVHESAYWRGLFYASQIPSDAVKEPRVRF